MNFQELNQNEMTQINGGGLFDSLGLGSLLGNNGGASQGGLTGGLGLGSLLSLSNTSADGSKTELTLGKGIVLNLGSIFSSL